MVVFNCKCGSDGDAFLYETTTDTPNDDLIAALVSLHNGRVQARVVVDAVRGLAAAGPMVEPSPPVEAEQQQQRQQQQCVQRCGDAPDPDHVEALTGTAAELERYVDKDQAQKRVVVSEAGIAELVGKVREVIRSAYPDGLPEWDVLSKLSASTGICKLQELLPGDAIAAAGLLDSKTTSLWVAGKEFERGRLVSDRLGSNEKTRVVAKLSREGDGPPAREPIVRDDERNAMLEHYHKRNEELKRLADNEEDEYMNSAWADPQNMARELQGLGSVRAPGLHRFG
jgi:hypothetical protein